MSISPVERWSQEELDEDAAHRERPQWFKFFYAAWLLSTAGMDDDQRGWYIRLLTWAASEGDIPGYLLDDDDELKEIAGFQELNPGIAYALKRGVQIPAEVMLALDNIREAKWKKVRSKFKSSEVKHPGYCYNRRLISALDDAYHATNLQREHGKLGAKKAWANREEERALMAGSMAGKKSDKKGKQREKELAKMEVLPTKELIAGSMPPSEEPAKEGVLGSILFSSFLNQDTKDSTIPLEINLPEREDLVLEENDIEVREINISPARETKLLTRQANEVFDFWKQDHPGAKFGSDRRTKVEARLREGYTVEQLKNAILGNKESPYHRGENTDGKPYMDLELICRKSSKVEEFIATHERFLAGGNGSGRPASDGIPTTKTRPWESAAERNARIEQDNANYTAELRSRGQRDPTKNPPPLSLTTDDD